MPDVLNRRLELQGSIPVYELDLDLRQMFVERLQTNLVLVLQGLVQLAVPMGAPDL